MEQPRSFLRRRGRGHAAYPHRQRPREATAQAGGEWKRVDLESIDLAAEVSADRVLGIDEAIAKLGTEDPEAARIVKLRYFVGLSIEEAAELLGVSRSRAYEHWAYARAWLHCELSGEHDRPQS